LELKSGDVSIAIDQSSMGGYHGALGGYAPVMGAYLAVPSGHCRGSIVLIQEIFGVTPAMRAIADDYASEGFAVLVPDIYWRLERNLDLGNGEEAAQRDIAVDYSKRYDETLGTYDLIAAVDWLGTRVDGHTKPAVMGFCLGGRMAVRVAAKAELSCMVSMYGVGLDKMDQEIGVASCPVQFHFGENDNHNSLAVIEHVRRTVADRRRAEDEFFTYPDAQHAFYNRFRLDRFDESAHQLARSRVLAFLELHIGQPA
jgi:carboxymethylenebutenolidase